MVDSAANSPFGAPGDCTGALEGILDNTIAEFVNKYKNSPSLKSQDFNVLACAGKIEHKGYSHPIYIFKIMQLKVIPTKNANSSMYRSYIPPHVLFSVKDLDKVDLNEFMHQFTFFEAVSLHLLCMTEANSLRQYMSLQKHYSEITLKKRLLLIADNYLKGSSRTCVKRLSYDVLHVRNQIAHSLSPLRVVYRDKEYDTNSSTLVEDVKNSMNSAMDALALPYLESQQKLVGWLCPDYSLRYMEALSSMKRELK